jgi:hypothetical protein
VKPSIGFTPVNVFHLLAADELFAPLRDQVVGTPAATAH